MGRVKGPFGALRYHLRQIGWTVLDSLAFLDREGGEVDPCTWGPAWVQEHARAQARDAQLEAAARTRTDMEGAELGVDLNATRKALAEVARESPELAGAAEAVVRGA